MAPSIPLTAATAASYSLSIRTLSGGLAFCIYSEGPSPHILRQGLLEASAGSSSVYAMLQELYYEHEFLSYPFRRVTLYYEPEEATLAPSELLLDGQDELWISPHSEEHQSNSSGAPAKSYQRYALPDETKTFVLSWSREALQFLRRTLLIIEPLPYFAPTLEERRDRGRSEHGRELLLLLREGAIDLFLLSEGELLGYNSFAIVSSHEAKVLAGEAVFYAFSFWRHFALEGSADRVTIGYPEEGREASTRLLKAAAHETGELLSPYIAQITQLSYRSLPQAPEVPNPTAV
ncbi:DUF3822 family protein [uncultured Porphyromonas sp.]|uniref:DUF3822 family protein n=1 Tax=uncultured Porphyromonas sp. TaxID=159274 RepID=UPI00260A695C|nr:DUF3822 family protein [uncultured Porphyromonas sp.]